jgi:hypothetical protein
VVLYALLATIEATLRIRYVVFRKIFISTSKLIDVEGVMFIKYSIDPGM